MRKEPLLIQASWFAANALLIVSLVAVFYGVAWEFSTRSYLKGFSDAIVPASDDSEQKVEAILAWMSHGPARQNLADPGGLSGRNPEDTLNVANLLKVCGTATNAFVNLAQSSGLRARRMLLLDERGLSKHVVVEVSIDGRWAVVDPAFRTLLRLPDGRPATSGDLRDRATLQAATRAILGYPPYYTYEHPVHVRLERIPRIGKRLRSILNSIWPHWEESTSWTLLLERESFALLAASLLLMCFALATRLLLGWYCSSRLGIARLRLRDQLLRVGQMLAGNSG